MSHTHAAAQPGALPFSNVFGKARVAVCRVLQRVVVPVESTDEMNDVWRLYRLTRQSDSVRPVVLDALACEGGKR